MGHEDLAGVAEETLFRNYRKKIELAGTIMEKLQKKEKELGRIFQVDE
jgi:hypothetical protein